MFGTSIFTESVFYGNTALIEGGGIFLSLEDTTLTLTHCILWENRAGSAQEISSIVQNCTTPPMVTYCDIQGGFDGAGNIDADPLFVDAEGGDFHIRYDSPCRDAGNNSAVTDPFDFEGDPRIAFGTVDMGADEFYNHLYCTGDFTPSGAIQGKFIGLPGTSPIGLFIGSRVMNSPLQHKWGEFYLESPWLSFPLVFIPANGVLEITAMLPGSVFPYTPPYDIPMQALIGWELSNLFVLEVRK